MILRSPTSPAAVVRARNAVAVAFAVNGLAVSTWMARIPEVRDLLAIEPGQLGRLLLAIAAGSIVALPTAGLVISRIGAASTVAAGSVLTGLGLVVAGIGADSLSSVATTAAGLAALGYGSGSWDVAMNVEGATVERQLGRTIMPRFHAAFSLGTVTGASIGAAAAALDVSVAAHLSTIGIVIVITAAISSRSFLTRRLESDAPDETPASSVWRAWREPRTLLIGVMVMSFALTEGIANDWLAIALVDGYDVSNAAGSAGFALFVTAMTLSRTAGTHALDRFGRVRTLQFTGGLAAAGVLLVVFGDSLGVALVGVVLWGAGAALGFPLGMSAAADDPAHAPGRVSVVSSIGYTAFLAGPPLLGWLGDHEGILQALLVAVIASAVGAMAASAARKTHADRTTDRVA